MFDFETQLKVGETGEAFFLKCYKGTKSDSRQYDIILENGDTVELKTDTYDMNETPNFFMEQFGNVKNVPDSLGGAWRAKRDRVNYFVYYFSSNRTFFWFEPNKLCKFLDTNLKKFFKKFIKNTSWTAVGYLVKRKEIEHLCVLKETFNQYGRKIDIIT